MADASTAVPVTAPTLVPVEHVVDAFVHGTEWYDAPAWEHDLVEIAHGVKAIGLFVFHVVEALVVFVKKAFPF